MTVLAAHRWPNNGALIADVARLYLDRSMVALDPTWGRGLWWSEWRPKVLVTHDWKIDRVDYRKLPEGDATFDLVAFDPPYVETGGKATSTIPGFNDAYGLSLGAPDQPKNPAERQAYNDDGLAEVHRVLRPKGWALVKCCDYISSGRLFPGTHHALTAAFDLGFELVDRLEHIGHVRAQPANRTRLVKGERVPTTQQHSRRNLSTLLVLRKRR